MKAKEFLTENSDWFDKSPGGEKLYFESEVIRMMNEYADEALRTHDVIKGQSERCVGCKESTGETKLWCCNHCGKRIEDF